MFKKEDGKTLMKVPGDINGMQFKIADLENCTVFLLDHVAEITIDRCKNTKFYIGPVKSSLFIRDCENCEVTISCSQFRCRDLKNSSVNLFTPNDPIIESSSDLTFAPYNFKYGVLKEHVLAANLVGEFTDDDGVLQKKVNKWNLVHDFTKREDDTLNYKLITTEEFKFVYMKDLNQDFRLEEPGEDAEWIFEYPVEFGGTLANNKVKVADSLKAFDIKDGKEAANEYLRQQSQQPEAITINQQPQEEAE